MSTAPQTLVDLRIDLAARAGVDKRNFGITGRATTRRPWGFHLGEKDITGGPPAVGMAKDYSVQHRRNKRGLTNASAGFDIRLPVGRLKKLAAHLVDLAKTGKDGGMLFEVIGPDSTGAAKRWAIDTKWQPRPARADHEWHIHISFFRDTEFKDKRPLFDGFFGTATPIPVDPTPELRLGAMGDPVKLLQDRLAEHGHPVVAPGEAGYGTFGPLTDDAVKAFQADNELVVDGIVGDITWAALLVDPPFVPEPGEPPAPANPEQPDIPDDVVAEVDAQQALDAIAAIVTEYREGTA